MTMLKIAKTGHQAKTIDFAKSSLWPKNENCIKNIIKTFLQHIAFVLCKKRVQKTANIRKIRLF